MVLFFGLGDRFANFYIVILQQVFLLLDFHISFCSQDHKYERVHGLLLLHCLQPVALRLKKKTDQVDLRMINSTGMDTLVTTPVCKYWIRF